MSSVERRALVSNQPLSAGTPEPGPQRGGVSSGAGASVPDGGNDRRRAEQFESKLTPGELAQQQSEVSRQEAQSARARRLWPETELKAQLRQKHWQTHRVFLREYDKAAAKIDPDLVGGGPLKAQFYRWLAGDVKTLPYPDHCRVLERMLPGCTVEELFAPAEKSRTERVANRDRLRLVTAAGEPNDSPDSVVGSAEEQICSPDLGVARQVDQIGPPDPVVGFRRELTSASEASVSESHEADEPVRLSQQEKTTAIDARVRSLMSWIGDSAPIKERDLHAALAEPARPVVDRRRTR